MNLDVSECQVVAQISESARRVNLRFLRVSGAKVGWSDQDSAPHPMHMLDHVMCAIWAGLMPDLGDWGMAVYAIPIPLSKSRHYD